jgi:N-ethylmaleimide reductase
MYAQLWHTGAMSHPDFFDGDLPMSASDVNPEQESVTPSGRKPTAAPRAMCKADICQTVADFGNAAKNAMNAGFDGVQIQANFLYLIAQFLNSATNHRTDEYGGSTENRARILFEIAEAVLRYVEPGRVSSQKLDEIRSALRELGLRHTRSTVVAYLSSSRIVAVGF